jgi:aspartate kinase
MHGFTNQLIESTKSFCNSASNREYDAVVSSGEQIAAGLLAMCLCSRGTTAISLTCWQIPIIAIGRFSDASIKSVNEQSIISILESGVVPIITGFQALSDDLEIMTIGRGGSDATAVAVAYAINADECIIYTDVDGVYTSDPRVVLNARRLSEISYDEMLALASGGAKVLQPRSILLAKLCNVKLRVLSSFTDTGGTIVIANTIHIPREERITGISHNVNLAKATIFKRTNANIDAVFKKIMHIKLFSITDHEISFLFQKSDLGNMREAIENNIEGEFEIDNDVGMLTIVGDWTDSNRSVAAKAFAALHENSITLKGASTSVSAILIMTQLQHTERALNILHSALFD